MKNISAASALIALSLAAPALAQQLPPTGRVRAPIPVDGKPLPAAGAPAAPRAVRSSPIAPRSTASRPPAPAGSSFVNGVASASPLSSATATVASVAPSASTAANASSAAPRPSASSVSSDATAPAAASAARSPSASNADGSADAKRSTSAAPHSEVARREPATATTDVATATAAPPAGAPDATGAMGILIAPRRAELLPPTVAGLAAPPPKPTEPAKPNEKPKDWWEIVGLGAFLDTYAQINWSLPRPQSSQGTGLGGNALRQYDPTNGFAIGWAGVNLSVAPAPIGGTLQLRFGPAAAIHNATEGNDGLQYVKQLYASFRPQEHVVVDVGKFDQPFGSEVADSQLNPNYSRSLLYTFAQPLFFTGVRADWNPIPLLDFKLLAVNGWNNSIDGNAGKTIAAQVGLLASDALSIYLGWGGGPEQPDTLVAVCAAGTAPSAGSAACAPAAGAPGGRFVVDAPGAAGRWRHLLDAVVDWKPVGPLRLLANLDYGTEDLGGSRANWYGGNLAAVWSFSEAFSAAIRGEAFVDDVGYMTGIGKKVNLESGVLTLSWSPDPHVLLRWENRADVSSEPVFWHQTSPSDKAQVTSTIGVVVSTAALR